MYRKLIRWCIEIKLRLRECWLIINKPSYENWIVFCLIHLRFNGLFQYLPFKNIYQHHQIVCEFLFYFHDCMCPTEVWMFETKHNLKYDIHLASISKQVTLTFFETNSFSIMMPYEYYNDNYYFNANCNIILLELNKLWYSNNTPSSKIH